MFKSILSNETSALTSLNINTALITIAVAIIIGMAIGIAYIAVAKKRNVSHNLAMALIVMPAMVAVMILLIGSNVATAFSLAGVCTLVRFRSIPGDAKDIAFIFLSATSGLAVGTGYETYAIVFTVIILAVILVYMLLIAGADDENVKVLRITIPENLNFQDAFDDIFDTYTKGVRLEKTKTINLGTLFELTYTIKEKENIDEKAFIDAIRERNGNLNIMLMRVGQDTEHL